MNQNHRLGLLLASIVFIIEGSLLMLGISIIGRGGSMIKPTETNGFVGLFIGLILLSIYIKSKAYIKIEYSKCPKCKETYTYSTLEKGMCPKCDIKTIDIEKYFEKFPDERK